MTQSTKQKTIMVVDDEFHIVNVLSLKLKHAQFNVVNARNGEEAWEQIEQTAPDLVITDFSMPVMNGLDLVRKIRAGETTRTIPIIMLTARGQEVEEADEEATKIDQLMGKPFSPREILSKVQDLLGED